MTLLKQELHSDDVKTSEPQATEDSFSHSFPHLIHFTRNVVMPSTSSMWNSVVLDALPLSSSSELAPDKRDVKHILWAR